MRITVTGIDGILAKLELIVSHNEENLIFDISSFDKKRFEKFDVFEHINDYWAKLLAHEQEYIFGLYKKINEVFVNNWENNNISLGLYPLVAELVDYHDFDRIRTWISIHPNVNTPHGVFKEAYVINEERTTTREQTYLLHEFYDIRVLSLILRSVVPVWGEFLARTKKESGTAHKEYFAYNLLCRSKLMYSDPMLKLGTYIENSLGQDKAKHTAIINGISSEEFPIWLTGLVLVRRLCTGDIRGLEPKAHLVALLHKYVSHKVNGPENNYASIVNPKPFMKEGDTDSNNLSKLEQYKIKQELSAGDIVAMEFIFSDIETLARRLAPTMDMTLLHNALKTTAKLNEVFICMQQIVITQWVLKPVMPAKCLLYVSKGTVVKAIALAQAVLIHREHHFLAAVVSSIEVSDKESFSVSSSESRARIPKEITDELNIYYPFYKRSASKQKMLKPTNQAIVSIDRVTDMIALNVWRPTIDPVYYKSTHRWIQIPHDIKVKVATLVLELAKRSWKQ